MPRQHGARARDEQRHGGLRETASASQGPERFGNTSVDYVPRAACRVPRAACRVPRVSGLRGCGPCGRQDRSAPPHRRER
ncbi:conserved hypothetical protein [Burkholderia pseudomallei 576]|nr:conserved hypothetical protein [Burkholderia pseudomallei 576]